MAPFCFCFTFIHRTLFERQFVFWVIDAERDRHLVVCASIPQGR